jgi:type I restriction enzyme M protein
MSDIRDELILDEVETHSSDEQRQEDSIVDILTGNERKSTEKEKIVQRMVQVLAAEYHFPLESMSRDVPIPVNLGGRVRTKLADLIVFASGQPHSLDQAERIVVVQPPGTKPGDPSRGIELLKDLLDSVSVCEYGVWLNGRDIAYLRKIVRPVQSDFQELSDFPGNGESLDDLERPDRRVARVAVAEDLRETILRCHDYLYGNQSMQAPRAFAEMVKLIFCKIADERHLRANSKHRRQFWVGVTERNTPGGQRAISARIKDLFARVKMERDLRDVFRANEEIELAPKHLAWIAGELSRYQFLDAEVDVKGMAYEAMVATTMKRERGQFFTPRNIVEAMIEILAPQPGERVLDPACGSGRFLVACLDRFRRQQAESFGAASEAELRRRRNSSSILGQAAAYARDHLFGIDVDPELQRAAKMNMLINNDGHGNLFATNSLEASPATIADRAFVGAEHLGFGTFDVVVTNPPFGAKIPVDDPSVLRGFSLAHRWTKTTDGVWVMRHGALRSKMPPEILFIERCWHWLREGGRMGIVLPDGILGNPDNEAIRAWILEHARVLASIDLPVEAFLPQVGVQASLLFLEKKTKQEINVGTKADYPIFMAVAEFVGHDRRGNPVYRRDLDGFDIYEPYTIELSVLRNGVEKTEMRQLRRRQLADDLPLVARAYRTWRETGVIPSSVRDEHQEL